MVDHTVHCPLVTPFDDEGALDLDAFESVATAVLDAGIDGLVPLGTTGEFASLTRAERRAVLERAVAVAAENGDAPVLAGVGATAVADAVDALAFAAETGADYGLLVLPYFHAANDPAGNVRFLRRVADESPLPLYLYNIPQYVGAEIGVEAVAELADHDRVVGLKDSGGDFGYACEVLASTPDGFELYQGVEALLVPSVLMEATGGINALSNVVPEVLVAVRDALDAGDHDRARTLHRGALQPLFGELATHGFASGTKAALRARGRLETDAVRPPLVPLDDDAREDVASAVADALALVE